MEGKHLPDNDELDLAVTPDAGDLGKQGWGDKHCLGEMAPFVSIFLLRLLGLGISSNDPCNRGGCSPSLPVSEVPL